MKDVDLGEPTSFLDHVHLGCTQRECRISKDIAHNYRICSSQGFLPGLQKNTRNQKPQGNLMPKRYLHGPMTWKVMQRSAWKRYCEHANKTTEQKYKVATPCMDDHQFKEEERMDQLENYPLFAHKLFEMSKLGTY